MSKRVIVGRRERKTENEGNRKLFFVSLSPWSRLEWRGGLDGWRVAAGDAPTSCVVRARNYYILHTRAARRAAGARAGR